jgi:ligand-binding SRPBCC domain-containing protein
MMAHRFHSVQRIPGLLPEAWAFFSNPRNLPRITPPWLSFEVLSEPPEKMYPGLLIEYRVRPLWGVPVGWMTEITHLVEPSLFVDEQRFGPYRLWHHQHRFRAIEGGVEMEDEVRYLLPGGAFGRAAQRFLVRDRLEEIFAFRREAVERIFGKM